MMKISQNTLFRVFIALYSFAAPGLHAMEATNNNAFKQAQERAQKLDPVQKLGFKITGIDRLGRPFGLLRVPEHPKYGVWARLDGDFFLGKILGTTAAINGIKDDYQLGKVNPKDENAFKITFIDSTKYHGALPKGLFAWTEYDAEVKSLGSSPLGHVSDKPNGPAYRPEDFNWGEEKPAPFVKEKTEEKWDPQNKPIYPSDEVALQFGMAQSSLTAQRQAVLGNYTALSALAAVLPTFRMSEYLFGWYKDMAQKLDLEKRGVQTPRLVTPRGKTFPVYHLSLIGFYVPVYKPAEALYKTKMEETLRTTAENTMPDDVRRAINLPFAGFSVLPEKDPQFIVALFSAIAPYKNLVAELKDVFLGKKGATYIRYEARFPRAVTRFGMQKDQTAKDIFTLPHVSLTQRLPEKEFANLRQELQNWRKTVAIPDRPFFPIYYPKFKVFGTIDAGPSLYK